MSRICMVFLCILIPTIPKAAEYYCEVKKKFNTERTYTLKHIKLAKFSVKIKDNGGTAFISRCSMSHSERKVTCDQYKVDKVVYDNNVKIKKYYMFRSQFDVQLFRDLFFIENNGRGGIAFGKCHPTSP